MTVKGNCYIAVAANKDDLNNKSVNLNPIKDWCQSKGFEFFITSAKTGSGIQEMFNSVIKNL